MICPAAISSPGRGAVKVARASWLAAALLSLTACAQHAPKGQVVAVVNNQDVTNQDLNAEEAASGARGGGGDKQGVLQRVIARILLAQSAHARKLDAYAGFPSDMARLQQNFLAQRALQQVVKPLTKPDPADVAKFMAAHPFAFGQRTKFVLDEIRFQSPDGLKSLQGATSLNAIEGRLKSLNTQSERATRTVDSAPLASDLVQRLASTPIGQVFYVNENENVLAIAIVSREPFVAPLAQQQSQAAQAMAELSTQTQINAEVNKLKGQAKISYQPGYAPKSGGTAPAAAH